MPIFISHSTRDDALAQAVYSRLSLRHGIECYIDDMDKELAERRGSSELTPLLVDRLRRCDTLLAIVSSNTKGSWWVPFEIGAAREMPRIIASYTSLPERAGYLGQEALPEYLLEWPRLKSVSDIDIFADEYKKSSLRVEASSGKIKTAGAYASYSEVRKLELGVMRSLGQKVY